MKKFLNRMWKDFQSGENIDLYITVAGSIIIATLNMVNLVPSSWVTPLTVSILALISFGILGNRYRIETILEKTNARNDILLTEFSTDYLNDMYKAKELTLLGVDLGTTMKKNYAQFLDKLEKGDTLNIIFVDPDSPACPMAAMNHFEPMTVDDKRNTILRSLNICRQLKQETGGKLQVRLLNYMPAFAATLIDPQTSESVIYLKYYRFKSPDGNGPRLVFYPNDGYWYESIKKEIARIWANSTVWPDLDKAASPSKKSG
jgi:hypothetical protein